ncbi:Fc receptor-like protein 5 [Ictidomys tridecemlineatus]
MRRLVFGSQVLVVPVFMLLWVTLLVLAPVSEQLVTPSKSIISLEFPWTVLFQGESIDLTCKGSSSHSPWTTKWYFKEKVLRRTPKSTLRARESGDYRCQADDLPVSDPVHLEFSTAPLILQGPPYVFEGDSVLLRCRTQAKTELNTVAFFKNGESLMLPNNSSDLHIDDADLAHNGHYHCGGYMHTCCTASSNRVSIQVRMLFPRPELSSSSSEPTEGSPVTLACQTQLPPERSHVQLQFCFFRDGQVLGSGWSSSPELRIPALGTEDSGSYWCQAKRVNSHVLKESWKISIPVRGESQWVLGWTGDGTGRVVCNRTSVWFVWNVLLPRVRMGAVKKGVLKGKPTKHVNSVPFQLAVAVTESPGQSPLMPMFEGKKLTLICLVDRLPGPITFSWYKVKLGKETKIHTSSEAEFKISMVTDRDAGDYYCNVNSSHKSFTSRTVTIKPRKAAVSRPVLTLSPPNNRVREGTWVTLHCEVQRGSPPILFKFYHESVSLGRSSTRSTGRASLGISLTTKHSGNYYCTADNGYGPQRSEAVSLSVATAVSRPVLTLSPAENWLLEGTRVTLHCEVQRGSPPILYKFYHESVSLGSSSTPSTGRASLGISLTTKHSGNYYCTADNGYGPQRSAAVRLSVLVPVSRPVFTLKNPSIQPVVGDMVELHCEALGGSPPILYQFYLEDVTLGNSSVPSGGGASFNLSLTAEHSGNYSCEADNGQGAQRSEVVALFIPGKFLTPRARV